MEGIISIIILTTLFKFLCKRSKVSINYQNEQSDIDFNIKKNIKDYLKDANDNLESYNLLRKREEEYLDEVIIEFKTLLKENNFIEACELFDVNQEAWQKYYESQINYELKFLKNIQIKDNIQIINKSRVFNLLTTRCDEIAEDIIDLEYIIDLKKTDKND